MSRLRRVLDCFRIKPVGVLHIGAFAGHEDKPYRELGFRHRLFVEAQPDTFARLKRNLAGSGAACEHVAISDRIGTATFNVMANGQSSSLLKPLRHLDAYPAIRAGTPIEVPTTTIDELLSREPYREQRFNFITIDIQGAELLALAGATETLPKTQALQVEVSFEELYAGGPHVRDIDAFLWDRGFVRVDTKPSHRTWGDAIYVSNALTKAPPRQPRSRPITRAV